MADDTVSTVFELIDKASGPAEKIVGGLEGISGAMGNVEAAAPKVGKMERAIQGLTIALRGIQIAHGVVELSKAFGGFEKLKAGVRRMGAAIGNVGRSAGVALKKVAPFAIGGAGIYGLGKLASGVAIPALGGVALGFTAVAGAATVAAGAIAYLGVKAAVAFSEAAIGAAEFRESSELAFAKLRGGSGVAQFERIRNIALRMGTPLEETVHQFQKLAAMQFNQADSEKFFGRMQDLRAVGASAEQTGRAMLAITQIKSAGKLQGDELNQLAEAGVSVQLVLEELGKAAGKSVPEIVKLKEAGKITADMALDAIEKAIGKKTGAKVAGDAGRDFMTNTFRGMRERIKNLGGIILDDMGKAFAPAFKELTPLLKRTFRTLTSGEFRTFVADVGDVFGRMLKSATRLEPVAQRLFRGLTGGSSVAVLDGIAGGFDLLITGIEKAAPLVEQFAIGFGESFGDGLVELKIFAQSLVKAFGGNGLADGVELARELGRVFGDIVILSGKVVAGLAAVAGIGASLVAGLGAAISFLVGWPVLMNDLGQDIGRSIGDGIVGGLKASVAFVRDAAMQLANAVPEPIRKVLGIHSPSTVARDDMWNVGLGGALGLYDSIPLVSRAANDLGSAAMPTLAPSRPGRAFSGRAPGARFNARVSQSFNIQSGESGSKLAQQIAGEGRRGYDAGLESLALQFGVG